MCFKTFIRYISAENFQKLGFKHNLTINPRHWFQYADDASITSGLERKNQILLNAFSRWCEWSMMIIRVDKCKTFGTAKRGSQSKQFLPKMYVNNKLIPQVKLGESFAYLGRHYNFQMDETKHRESTLQKPKPVCQKIYSISLLDILIIHLRHERIWSLGDRQTTIDVHSARSLNPYCM